MATKSYSESNCGCQFTHYTIEGVDANTKRTKTCKTHKGKRWL